MSAVRSIGEARTMMITLPIFMPVVQQMGIDLVWFGVMFLISIVVLVLVFFVPAIATWLPGLVG